MRLQSILLGVFLLSVGSLQAATTYSDLLAEIAAAEDGATVYVEADMEYSSILVNGIAKSITIASPEGETNVLTRARGFTGELVQLSDAAGAVTLRNIVVDGNKAAGQQSGRFIRITAGTLTLDAGTEFRNVKQSGSGTIWLTDTGALVMNDGAVMRGFENASWGTCVLVGTENKSGGTFTMNGGLITDCNSTRSGTSSPGAYGGAVYTYGGDFNFYGGLITGNRATNCTAGIAVYTGNLRLKGNATVTNNVGNTVNDIAYWGDGGGRGWIIVDGPWTGLGTVYAPRVATNGYSWACYVNGHAGFTPGTDYYRGLGNLSVQDHPEYVANGWTRYLDAGYTSVYFGPRCVRLGARVTTATWDEARASFQDGDVVELFKDIESSCLWITNGVHLTFRSETNEQHSIKRTLSQERNSFFVVRDSEVTFENVIVDGQGDLSTQKNQAPLIYLSTNGVVTLGQGAILQNCITETQRPAVYAERPGGRFTMEDGSIVRNFQTTSGESWATAIRIGIRDVFDDPPVFVMNGGVISNCVSGSTGNAGGGYGGAVYIQNAAFYMNGGIITENSALSGGCAGVQAYGGSSVYFSGNAIVTNNPGVKPDVFRCDGANLRMRGTFRGAVGVSSGTQEQDSILNIVCEEGATGAWNFFSAGTDPYGKYVGYMWNDNRYVYLQLADGWVDGRGIVSKYEDFSHFTPTAIDADAERDELPHTFGGAAARAGGSVAVTFDEAAARTEGRTNVTLIAADEGSVLTGAWSFTVPVAEKGMWKIVTDRTEAGIVAYRLVWCPPGMVIVVR